MLISLSIVMLLWPNLSKIVIIILIYYRRKPINVIIYLFDYIKEEEMGKTLERMEQLTKCIQFYTENQSRTKHL
jgi:hypothetical protein